MRLLDRYLLRELLLPFAYCFCGFLVFWISFEFVSEMDEFQRNHLLALDIARYYLIRTPKMLVDIVMPVSLLLSLLYTLTNHSRHNELTAMRAAGVSLWRVCVPYLAVGVALSAAAFAMNEYWVPTSVERADDVVRRYQPDAQGARLWHRNLNFLNSRDQRIWSIGAFQLKTHELRGVHVEWKEPDGSARKLMAESANWTNGAWHFSRVEEFLYHPSNSLPDKVVTNELAMPEFSETPELIKSEIKISTRGSFKESRKLQFSTRDILEYEAMHPNMTPRDRDWLNTKLHERLAAPFTCLIVVLIAIPFGTPSGRRNAFAGVASSIFICFAYFVLKEFSLASGTGGHVPPWLAAWLPNFCFAALGIGLTFRVR
ncbi:MAG TPA: LptF/LptG family permease [Verrucomicrobiae bacterium]|nr:LptF/LptG family permease [Verrucomicrobiae bacterium]